MSSGRTRKILCNGPGRASTACSSYNPPCLSIPGLCRSMPIGESGMREAGPLILVFLYLFPHDERHTTLHEPLAGRTCLLIQDLANHLARKGISIERLRFFNLCPLTRQSIAQELFQSTQTLLLI